MPAQDHTSEVIGDIMDTIRRHQVALKGVVSTVVVTTLVLEGARAVQACCCRVLSFWLPRFRGVRVLCVHAAAGFGGIEPRFQGLCCAQGQVSIGVATMPLLQDAGAVNACYRNGFCGSALGQEDGVLLFGREHLHCRSNREQDVSASHMQPRIKNKPTAVVQAGPRS